MNISSVITTPKNNNPHIEKRCSSSRYLFNDMMTMMMQSSTSVSREGGVSSNVDQLLMEGGGISSNTTPLRAGFDRLPRRRILEKYAKLDTVPLYVSKTRGKIDPVRSFFQGYKTNGVITSTRCTADRFIPRRRGQNFDATYHHLIAEPPKKQRGCILDLPNDLNHMDTAWEKVSMSRYLENVIPGTARRRILNFSQSHQPSSSSSVDDGREKILDDNDVSQDEYTWPVKPRKRPSIKQPHTILDIPNFRPNLSLNLLDWSSKNMMAAAIGIVVCIVNGSLELDTGDTKLFFSDRCTAVKFSNSGDKIAIGTESSETCVYRTNPKERLYLVKCDITDHIFRCRPQTYAWSSDDRYLVAGCSGGYIQIVDANQGLKIRTIENSSSEIITLSFSPKDTFIACSGREPYVRIFSWPTMEVVLEIDYCTPVRAMAWHPWECSVLCIGGGEGDGGLSVMNISRPKCLLYRNISFNGCVDWISWNKVTGEMVVNWFIRKRGQCFVAMPVYADFNRVTDAIVPTLKKNRVAYVAWSPDGSQIACQAGESVFIYNFLDDHTNKLLERRKKRLHYDSKKIINLSRYSNLR